MYIFALSDVEAIVTDSGANFVKAVKDLVEAGVTEESVLCSCHLLQLSIKNGLEVPSCNSFHYF